MKINKLFFFLFLCLSLSAIAQDKTNETDSSKISLDDLKLDYYLDLNQLTKAGKISSQSNYDNNLLIRNQNILFNLIEIEIQKAKNILKQGVDYKGFTLELDYVVELKKSALIGVIDQDENYLTYRNLSVTSLMLNEISNRIENQLIKIKGNNDVLSSSQNKIDSLFISKELYISPKDTAARTIYFNQFMQLNGDYKEINSLLRNGLDSIHKLEILGSKFKFNLQSDIIEINNLKKTELDALFSKKFNLFSKSQEKENFVSTFIYSLKKEILLLLFYAFNHFDFFIIIFLAFLATAFYLKLLKKKYEKANLYDKFNYPVQILRHPFSSSIVIVFTLFQFFLPQPPFALMAIFWTVIGISLTILFKKTTSVYYYTFWIGIFILNLLAIFDNTILLHSVSESWFLVFIASTSILFGLHTLKNRKKWDSELMNWIVVLMIILEVVGIVFMLLGNYNFAKVIITIGLYNIFIAIMLLSTFHLTKDIGLYSEYLKDSDEEKKLNLKTIEYHKISKKYVFLFVLGWFILVARNTYWYQKIISPFELEFSKPRNIGDFNYTYNSVFIFFMVLIISTFISKIVSFLASDKRQSLTNGKTNKIGSWLLLIRILIICIGIIIAFSSAGIPMNQFTIIISALSVGIGFGLQTLVNNLVSGIIIAFEKPVNLDDIIEIGGQTGQMKSIGLRSSVVTTYDGADVIIPNGDLLNQHMTNWTMGSAKRRYEINIGVAYGTDLKLTKSLIEKVLSEHALVLKNPAPMVWFTIFNDSSIDFTIKYWVPHFNYGNDVKSDLIIAIDEIFKANNIVIPFPQQDIHIQTNLSKFDESEEV
ncbi:MAG: mechanosensitive ion channel [Flavobacterium sp.]|jgi:potassium efflux system protein|nr:mechanosensitive ion channel [Flavobacterium sp.]HQV35397.1 mechanosensitive ion channel [Flavobacterium sp.]HQX03125.1 mechanosensitive ion channel [Flavobacterium sp.]HRZ32652.1 mechanosensitive ion channel [Flavobacterium sp.]